MIVTIRCIVIQTQSCFKISNFIIKLCLTLKNLNNHSLNLVKKDNNNNHNTNKINPELPICLTIYDELNQYTVMYIASTELDHCLWIDQSEAMYNQTTNVYQYKTPSITRYVFGFELLHDKYTAVFLLSILSQQGVNINLIH